ncbi:hypothetical protein CPF_1702 [Clostridium perfringens ATCC 13124]|jgi:gas vesicle protein|nr:hypothetical protein CPF_1702 [Clostridium perfringens ATCC 13124]ABG87148.1 hypothetical protein CPR_1435 [Clostridium perfringens SM101]DAI61710.1 MAG TPA: YtxH-like protein [Caudoviricetes sp.]
MKSLLKEVIIMAKKLMTTLAIGAIGAAVGMMVTPNLDRKTQRALKKASRRMIDAAGESMGWME